MKTWISPKTYHVADVIWISVEFYRCDSNVTEMHPWFGLPHSLLCKLAVQSPPFEVQIVAIVRWLQHDHFGISKDILLTQPYWGLGGVDKSLTLRLWKRLSVVCWRYRDFQWSLEPTLYCNLPRIHRKIRLPQSIFRSFNNASGDNSYWEAIPMPHWQFPTTTA